MLDTIPGMGGATAAALLAEVPDIKQYKNARQVAAFAGLVPRQRQSGSSALGHRNRSTTRVYVQRITRKRDKHSRRISERIRKTV